MPQEVPVSVWGASRGMIKIIEITDVCPALLHKRPTQLAFILFMYDHIWGLHVRLMHTIGDIEAGMMMNFPLNIFTTGVIPAEYASEIKLFSCIWGVEIPHLITLVQEHCPTPEPEAP